MKTLSTTLYNLENLSTGKDISRKTLFNQLGGYGSELGRKECQIDFKVVETKTQGWSQWREESGRS